jgi:hypothetical protein
MVRKLVIAAAAVVSVAAGLVSGRAVGTPDVSIAARGGGCRPVPAFARDATPRLGAGEGMWAVAGGRLISIDGGRSMMPPVGGARSGATAGTIKHIAASKGFGTAYVLDRRGDDEIVVVTVTGTHRVAQTSEASNPAWSPRGDLAWSTGASIAVLDHATAEISTLSPPLQGATVFSPVFLTADRLAAVVSAAPTDLVPEGERLGNLWATRLGSDRWRRLTRFEADDERWVTVRTPIAHGHGIDFVRVVGRASSTRSPRFEHWRYEQGRARRVSELEEERYLAGLSGGHLVWNVPDPREGRQLLAVGGPRGLRTIGCGAVMADPIDAVDPDRRYGRGTLVPSRGTWPDLETRGHDDHAEEVAVIVGDFVTSAEAEAVAGTIGRAFPGSLVEVVDSSSAPLAIRPGVFGALLHLPPDAEPTAALANFRDRVPEYAAASWIVTP